MTFDRRRPYGKRVPIVEDFDENRAWVSHHISKEFCDAYHGNYGLTLSEIADALGTEEGVVQRLLPRIREMFSRQGYKIIDHSNGELVLIDETGEK